MSLQDKTALITGGSKGIGFGIATKLLNEGMKVAITGRNRESLDQAVQFLKDNAGKPVMGIQADVRKIQDQEEAVNRVVRNWGSLDVLIANAGVGYFASIEDLTPRQWNEIIDINLTGAYNTIKTAVKELKESSGYFITIASLAGTNFFEGGSAYNASKFGLVGFTQAVMLDLRNHGIKTSTIMPGSVATGFNNRTPTAKDSWKIQPEDIGQLVVDLLKMDPRTLPSKIEVRPSNPKKS